MTEEDNGNAAAIIRSVVENQKGELREFDAHGEKEYVVELPAGRRVESLKKLIDAHRKRPERQTGFRTLTTVSSFVEYVNRHKTSNSVVFLDDRRPANPELCAVFNANGPSGEADFEDFGAKYAFPMSDEWKVWRSEKANLSQEAFADLIEQNIRDLVDPANVPESVKRTATEAKIVLAGPQKMLTLSKGLTVNIDSKFTHKVNLQTGGGELFFKEEASDEHGNALEVPGGFCLGIPVFKLGPLYPIAVRLRYRKASQTALAWTLTLFDVERVLETCIAGAAQEVGAQTELPVFRGG